ncbi:MAG: flagellar hook-associated protein FlgK [Cellulosilyticaceae bacterium]
MGSAFFEYNIAMSGLFAAQRGLAVTSNNINSAAMPGYSRQVLGQKASAPLPGFGVGMHGTGVETTSITRVRDSYLDIKLWNQNPKLGEYQVKTEQNALVESVFGEPSEAGFTKVFDNFFKSIDDLSKLPSEGERKEALRQMMISFTKYYNSTSQSLSEFQRDLNFEVKVKVDEVNMLATRIQSLNQQIYEAEMYGDMANSLRDERDLAVDRLSQLINVEAREVEVPDASGKMQKHFIVKANGQTMIDHTDMRLLTVTTREPKDKKNPEDLDGLYDVGWADGMPFDMGDPKLSGELKGAIDMRDGRGTDSLRDADGYLIGADGNRLLDTAGNPIKDVKLAGGRDVKPDVGYKGIPYYVHKMDNFVRGFAQTMNEIYNRDKDGNQLVPPQYLFEVPPQLDAAGNPIPGTADYNRMTAANFGISADILKDAGNIRTNYEHIPPDENPNPSSNDLLLDLLGQKNNGSMFKEGDPKDFMISMFSELGINTKEAQMYQQSQTNITNTIKKQRDGVSQVDTNEEFLNLVKYNQAYQNAARLINTIDGIYETTIFKLGNW